MLSFYVYVCHGHVQNVMRQRNLLWGKLSYYEDTTLFLVIARQRYEDVSSFSKHLHDQIVRLTGLEEDHGRCGCFIIPSSTCRKLCS